MCFYYYYFINIKPRAHTDGICMQYVDAMSIDIWNAGINSELHAPKFAIAKTGMPLHMHAPIH